MKKKLALALVLVMSLSAFTACDKKDSDDDDDDDVAITTTLASTTDEVTTTAPVVTDDSENVVTTVPTDPLIEVELSDNLEDFEVAINGEKYTVPMSYADLTAKGWEYQSKVDEKIESNSYLLGMYFKKGDMEIVTWPTNMTKNEITVAESQITYMKFYEYGLGDRSTQVQIAKGIALFRSTYDDVIAAFGEPDRSEETYDGFTSIVYKFDTYSYYKFKFNDDNILEEIEMENVVDTSEKSTDDTSNISTDPNDILSFQVKINDVDYQFPMAYADFTAKGWVYDGDDSTEIDANTYSLLDYYKLGDLRLSCQTYNGSDEPKPFTECVIGEIDIEAYQLNKTDVKVTLPGGFDYTSATKEQLIEAYGEPDDTVETDMSTEITYKLDAYQSVKLTFDKETGKLSDYTIKYFS